MWFFYLVAFLFFAAGGILWMRSSKIVLWEWLAGGAAAFVMAAMFHAIAFRGMTADVETWSGQVTDLRYVPMWMEQYTYTVTHSSGSGKNRRTWTTTHTGYETHPEHWVAQTSLDKSFSVSKTEYEFMLNRFGGTTKRIAGTRSNPWHTGSHMIAGDPFDTVAQNTTGEIEPVTDVREWTNRVKAAPTTFSFPQPPKNTPVFEYPENKDHWHSDRLLGDAVRVGQRLWDQMNSRLGPSKGVNVIMCGFVGQPSSIAQQQRAKWIGGKKNDLVICYGTTGSEGGGKPDWVDVFGWTESEICKQDLRSLLLEQPITAAVIPLIEKEVARTYEKKDWHKFDYITIEPPLWSYITFFAVVIVVQGGLWAFFLMNDASKESGEKPSYRGSLYEPFLASRPVQAWRSRRGSGSAIVSDAAPVRASRSSYGSDSYLGDAGGISSYLSSSDSSDSSSSGD